MDPEHVMSWIQAAAFVGTGLGVLHRLSAFTTRLDLMLKTLAKRVKKLERAERKRRDS